MKELEGKAKEERRQRKEELYCKETEEKWRRIERENSGSRASSNRQKRTKNSSARLS